MSEESRLYYQTNKARYNTPESKARRKAYREQNKENIKAKQKEYSVKYKTDPHAQARQREYYLRHKHIYYPLEQQRRKERLKTDPNYLLKVRLRTQVYSKIKNAKGKKCLKSLELIGCSVAEARKHIESLWLEGMSWANYTHDGWHIDHIKPCATFDLTNPEQQKQCFHYTNLRPLWAKDNFSRPRDGSDIWEL